MPRFAIMFLLSAGLPCFGSPGSRPAAEHGSSDPAAPLRPNTVFILIDASRADRVGNRLTMAESNGTGQRLTSYHYDEHDRLTRQTSSGPPLIYTASLTSDDGTAYAEVRTPPSRVAVYCLIAFAALTLGALFVPLRLLRPRRPDVGREARRRRTWIQTIALALIPLMAIGPEAALAINNEALLYQAVAAAAAGQTGQYETTYTYDANGNMVSRTVTDGGSPFTDTYIYDAQNRLVAAELTVDETAYVSYGYDADGIRNRVTKNGVTTWHLTDPNRDYAQVLAEHNGSGNVFVRYCYGDDLISQTRDPSGSSPATRFYHYDGQLSTRQLTEGTPAHTELGVVKDTYTFDAFGNLLAKTGLTANEYLYTGEQYDPNVRFYYLRARYYAQDVGRFTSRDPASGRLFDPPTLHRYTYCAGNPVNFIDPSGREFSLPALIVNIQQRVTVYFGTVSASLTAAFRAGGSAIGRLWNALGNYAQSICQQILNARSDLMINHGQRAGPRILDFLVQKGNNMAMLEVKWGLPRRLGESLSRLVSQMTAAVQNMPAAQGGAAARQQVVLWTLREPSVQQVNLVCRELGTQLASQVQFVHGVAGLWRWLELFFGPA